MGSFNDSPYAKIMVNSVRKYMPDSYIVQISDMNANMISGVNAISRGNFVYKESEYPRVWLEMLYGISKHRSMDPGWITYCDADMVFCGDIRELLEEDYDIAICKRPIDDGTSLTYRIYHPYNVGFMVIKSRKFLKTCLEAINMFFEKCHLSTGQHVIGLVVNSGEFKVKILDGEIYNKTPDNLDDYDEKVKIWHFKGDRKQWTEEWIKRHHVNGSV
jgi:hypothetical protein